MVVSNVIVLDNGAGTAKIGYATDNQPRVMPNCVIKAKNVRSRIFIGSQIDECKDQSGLYYLLGFQKGFLVNWEIEKQVWDHMFGKEQCKVDFDETSIIVTEPYFNFTSIQDAMNEVLFEEYGFQSIFRTNAAYLSQYKHRKESQKPSLCTMVLDCGYSFSHVVPYCEGKKLKESIRRISVGGKVLTNHLKEIISYRQLMVMDETHVMNQCKEDVCYVSTDFYRDMEICKKRGKENTVARDYVLPDYTHIKRGHVRDPNDQSNREESEQSIRMNNERFSIPELLFHPSDVGIQEMGITEGIVDSIKSQPEEQQPHLYGDILLTGGNCVMPGFHQRTLDGVRSLADSEYPVNATLAEDPITYAWQGGAFLGRDSQYHKMVVTKQQYEEHGSSICEEKFDV